jgi:hypothetical protein
MQLLVNELLCGSVLLARVMQKLIELLCVTPCCVVSLQNAVQGLLCHHVVSPFRIACQLLRLLGAEVQAYPG